MEQSNSPKPYQKINSCTQPVTLPQALAIIIFATIQVLNANLIPHIIQMNSTFLLVVLALKYVTLAVVVILYIVLLIIDPTDIRVKLNSESTEQMQNNQEINSANQNQKYCEKCKVNVSQTSYHCNSCNRCVQEFDHHCIFINNCIGKENYRVFIALLIFIICNMSLNMGMSVWLGMALEGAYRAVSIIFGVLSFAVFLEIGVLTVFHAYISFYLYKRTVEILAPQRAASCKSIKISNNHNTQQQSGSNLKAKQHNLTEIRPSTQETSQIKITKPPA